MNDVVNNEEAASEETVPTKKAKPNPFLDALHNNQVAQAKTALMKTVCADPSRSLGSIFESLENDSDGEYIMLDIFKALTIEELVVAASPYINHAALPPASAPVMDEEDDDDLDDDDEFEDDGSLDDDGEDEDEKAKAKAKKKKDKEKAKKAKANEKSKKKSSPKKAPKKKDKAKGKAKASNDDLIDKDYQKKILVFLREQKARDKDSAISGENIRNGNDDFEGIGGDADKLRANMNVLIEKSKADKFGKARGMKYFRLKKKK